jgi:multidrug transporter EmrE-like cation transporter
MIFSLCLALLAVFLTGVSQVLLKCGARRGEGNTSFFAPYLNILTISGYAILLIVTVISVIALREIPLKIFYALAALGYVVVAGLSWRLLKEGITQNKILAVLLIVCGIILFNI